MRSPAALMLPTQLDFLTHQSRRRGTGGGLVFRDRHVSFAELACATTGLATWLAKHGIGTGDRVGIVAANEPAIVGMLYAVWAVGAVAVPVGVRATAVETARLLDHARARAVLCDEARIEVVREAAKKSGATASVCAPAPPFAPRIAVRGPRRAAPRPPAPQADAPAASAPTAHP